MTVLEIKTAIAAYLHRAVSDLTVNGQDLGLVAMNQVRLQAELMHDFEFSRQLVSVVVDGVVGGSLNDAVAYGTTDLVKVKSVVDVGIFDAEGNYRPVDWTTTGDSLSQERQENPGFFLRYPTDGQAVSSPFGQNRFVFSGDSIYRFPVTPSVTFPLAMEVYTFANDWSLENAIVTGATGVLPVNGQYGQYGVFNGRPTYLSIDDYPDVYVIWYDKTSWIISILVDLGESPVNYYSLASTDLVPTGIYVPHGTFTGTPQVVTVAAVSASNVWTTRGQQYIQWASIVHLNNMFKDFVFRQEGNLPPPQTLADAGFEALKAWDIFRFEQSRRHTR